jgi:hypothetical protein
MEPTAAAVGSSPPTAAGSKRQLATSANGTADDDPAAKRAHTAAASDTVLRLLVTVAQADSLLLTSGGEPVVERIERETGAIIRTIRPVPGCTERLLVIYSPAAAEPGADVSESGAAAALQRLADALLPNGDAREGGEQHSELRLRLLVSGSQAASLAGADAALIQGSSGASLLVSKAWAGAHAFACWWPGAPLKAPCF